MSEIRHLQKGLGNLGEPLCKILNTLGLLILRLLLVKAKGFLILDTERWARS